MVIRVLKKSAKRNIVPLNTHYIDKISRLV